MLANTINVFYCLLYQALLLGFINSKITTMNTEKLEQMSLEDFKGLETKIMKGKVIRQKIVSPRILTPNNQKREITTFAKVRTRRNCSLF